MGITPNIMLGIVALCAPAVTPTHLLGMHSGDLLLVTSTGSFIPHNRVHHVCGACCMVQGGLWQRIIT